MHAWQNVLANLVLPSMQPAKCCGGCLRRQRIRDKCHASLLRRSAFMAHLLGISLKNTRILMRDSLNKIHATREAVAWMYCDIVSGSSKVVTEPAMRDDVLISSSFSFCCCRRDSRNRSHSHSRTHIRSGSCHSGSLRRHR